MRGGLAAKRVKPPGVTTPLCVGTTNPLASRIVVCPKGGGEATDASCASVSNPRGAGNAIASFDVLTPSIPLRYTGSAGVSAWPSGVEGASGQIPVTA